MTEFLRGCMEAIADASVHEMEIVMVCGEMEVGVQQGGALVTRVASSPSCRSLVYPEQIMGSRVCPGTLPVYAFSFNFIVLNARI